MKDNVKLGTLGDIFIGLTYRPEDVANEGVIVLRSGNIQKGRLNFDDIVRVKCNVRENLIVKPNDILMCSRNGSAKLVGKCTLLPEMDEEMSFGAFMTIIRTQHNPYLLHFFNSNAFRQQLGGAATTTINQITRKMLNDISVPIYSKEQEEYIVAVFNQIDELIWTETKKLDLFDELVKARFVELFGDPIADSMHWGQVPLSHYLKSIRYGASTPPSFSETGYEFIRATNIKSGKIVSSDMKYISEEEAQKIEKCKVLGGEMIIVRSGVNAGDTCIIADEHCGQYAGYDMILVFTEELNPVFVNVLINTEYMDRVVKPLTRRAAQPHLNSEQVQGLPIIQVPYAQQEQFATFVKQTDKSKLAIQQSLDKLETLKKSLMQKYFG